MKKLLPILLILALLVPAMFTSCTSQANQRVWRHPAPDGSFNLDEPGIMFRMMVLSMQPWRSVYRINEDGNIELYDELMWDEVGETRQPSEAVAALFGQPIAVGDQNAAADLAEAILAQEQAEGNFLNVELSMVTVDPLEDLWVLSFRQPGVPGWEGVVYDIAVRGTTGELVRMWVGGAMLATE
ncbi:MAG: hypothetical protein FWD06_03015 [Oscillospiraceae bacterium]|nr:hypothetical protein [Oscillospiraceae bacterium]